MELKIPHSTAGEAPDKKVNRSRALLRAAAEGGQLLSSSALIQEVMPDVLKLMGEAVDSDRTYIFELHADPQTELSMMTQRFEWHREGIESQQNLPSIYNHPVDPLFTELSKNLTAGKLFGGPVDRFPENLRLYMAQQGIQSFIVAPVMMNGCLWGFTGVDDCRSPREWTTREEDFLRTLAGCMGTSFSRSAAEERLSSSEKLLSGVALSTQRLLATTDIRAGLQEALAALADAAQVDRAYIFENEITRGKTDRRLRARYLWTRDAGASTPTDSVLQDLSYEELFPRWFDILSSGRPISGRVMDFFIEPKPGEPTPLRSILLVPIMSENRFWGVVGFDDGDISRRWDAGAEAILSTVAGGMGGAMARHHTEEALRHSTDLLRHSQKMEAVGRLAGGVAHDFNNLLTAIMGYGDILLDQMSSAQPMRHELEEICKAADRAHALTRQLLAFSRKQVLEPKVVNLNTLVADVHKLLIRLIGEDIELTADLDRDLGAVLVDPGQLEQVVINLAVNARDAMPEGGQLTLTTANCDLSQRISRGHLHVEPGPYVTLTVSDTGCGMDDHIQSHIFEPFFTTKEVGKGTGLGLSMVYGIIEQSGGHIMFDSAPGKGTSFTLYLPRKEFGSSDNGAHADRSSARGTETILLVEDEEMVRELASRVLRERGYTVWPTRSGAEALDVLERHGAKLNLLLTDIVMPQMSGQNLVQLIRKQRPELRVLYMSGYAQESYATLDALNLEKNFIQKPFTPPALARKVRDVLDTQ